MDTPAKPAPIRLYHQPHCWLDMPGEHPKVIEWRVCVVNGPLLMVTKNEALAKLLAAAPEMLEALQECVEYLGEPEPADFPSVQASVVNALIRNVRASVAKATEGAQPSAPRPNLAQTMAECDCPRSDQCERAGRCVAAEGA